MTVLFGSSLLDALVYAVGLFVVAIAAAIGLLYVVVSAISWIVVEDTAPRISVWRPSPDLFDQDAPTW